MQGLRAGALQVARELRPEGQHLFLVDVTHFLDVQALKEAGGGIFARGLIDASP